MSAQHAILWNPEQAERLAKFAHAGQVDKVGEDYWAAHLYDVVQILKYGTGVGIRNERYRALSEQDKILAEMAGWLHDLVEDTGFTKVMLLQLGAPMRLVEVLDLLNRNNGTSPGDYYRFIKADPVALAVKGADIASNTHPRRVAALRKVDPAAVERLAKKYTEARTALGLEDPWT